MPVLLRVKAEKVVTPLRAFTMSVPPRMPLTGLLASATVTLPVKVRSTLPKGSSALTTKPKPLPAVTLLGGCVVTTNCVAVAAATLKVFEIPLPIPGVVACKI